MNGFERRKQQKKLNILEAGLALFMENGVQGVSIAEIAAKADVSQVTIYNYFESKEKLVREVIIHYTKEVWGEYEQLFYNDLPFPEKIKQIIFDKRLTANYMHEDFFNQFMKEYAAPDNYISKLYTEKALPSFIKLFEQGKAQGYVDKHISNEAILLYIQMFADYMQREDVAELLLPMTEDLTKIFFYGVAGKNDTNHKNDTSRER